MSELREVWRKALWMQGPTVRGRVCVRGRRPAGEAAGLFLGKSACHLLKWLAASPAGLSPRVHCCHRRGQRVLAARSGFLLRWLYAGSERTGQGLLV